MATEKETSLSTTSAVFCKYDCPICLESVKSPRALPCLHTFCQDCLQSYISAEFSKKQDIVCPVCRKEITEPEKDLPHNKWAKAFPLNYFLTNGDVKQGNSAIVSEECKFCLRANNNSIATHYCRECTETICNACKNFHTLVPMMQKHIIVTLDDFHKHPQVPVDELCHIHLGKEIEVYCLDHKKMCCSICFATQHRHCKDVKSIDEYLAEPSTDMSVDQITRKLEKVSSQVEKEISYKKDLVIKMNASRLSASQKMKNSIEAAKRNLNVLHDEFEAELEKELSLDSAKAQNVLQVLRGVQSSVVLDKQMLCAVEKYGTRKQMFVTREKMKNHLAEQLRHMSAVASSQIPTGYSINTKALDGICRLKSLSSSMNTLGSGRLSLFVGDEETTKTVMGVKAIQPVISDVLFTELEDCIRQNSHDLAAIQPRNLLLRCKWEYELHAVSNGATYLNDTVAVVTSDGYAIILSQDGKMVVKHSIPYGNEPADINANGVENEVYISFRVQKLLKRYAISSKEIKEISTVQLKGIVEGFCIFGKTIVHASRQDCKIHISNLSGDLLKTITVNLAGSFGFVAGSYTKQMFYHMDGVRLYCRDLNGNVIKHVSLGNAVSMPRGIGVDFQGNIYVCCRANGKLIQVSHQDFSLCEYNGILGHYISFQPDGRSFVVDDFVSTFKYYKLESKSQV